MLAYLALHPPLAVRRSASWRRRSDRRPRCIDDGRPSEAPDPEVAGCLRLRGEVRCRTRPAFTHAGRCADPAAVTSSWASWGRGRPGPSRPSTLEAMDRCSYGRQGGSCLLTLEGSTVGAVWRRKVPTTAAAHAALGQQVADDEFYSAHRSSTRREPGSPRRCSATATGTDAPADEPLRQVHRRWGATQWRELGSASRAITRRPRHGCRRRRPAAASGFGAPGPSRRIPEPLAHHR